MTNVPPFMIHFMLFCGLFVGLGGALYLRFKLNRQVVAGRLERASLQRFTRGWCIAILLPCIAFWLLDLSSGSVRLAGGPALDTPQAWIGLALMMVCWLALAGWVWLGAGAVTLAKYLALTYDMPAFNNPMAIRVVVGLVVAASVGSTIVRIAME